MKSKIVVILITFIYYTNVTFAAGTAVSGYISKNTRWNTAGSPYIVTGNIIVTKKATLYIDSGVVVKFNKSKSIQVSGTIRAIGSNGNPVTFTSNLSKPSPGDWGFIYLNDTCTNYNYKTDSGSVFQYCILEFAGDSLATTAAGVYTALHASICAPFINNCKFRNNKAGALDFEMTNYSNFSTATLKVLNNTIYDNNLTNSSFTPGGLGIVNAARCSVTVSGNTIIHNKCNQGGGLVLTADNQTVCTISDNIISNNLGSFGGGLYFNLTGKFWLTGNIISGNNAQEGAGGMIGQYATTAHISNNLIYGNSGTKAAGLEINHGGDSLFINNNIFANNSASSDIGGLYIYNYTNKYTSIYKNQLIDNHSGRTTAFQNTTVPDFVPKFTTSIDMNTIYRNEPINLNDSAFAVTTNYTSSFMSNNIHTSDSALIFFELNNTSPQYSLGLNALDCYWGYASQSAIHAHIYDSINDPFLGTVQFNPFLTSPDTIAPVTPPGSVIKTDIGGGKIKLSWKQNTESDLGGYMVYSGSPTGFSFSNSIDAGKVNSYTLNAKLTDTIAITAYDHQRDKTHGQYAGNESWFTNAKDTVHYTGIVNTNEVVTEARIYPNPFSSQAMLEIKNYGANYDHYTMIIYDQLGKEIRIQDNLHTGLNTISKNDMPAGLYFYSISNKNGSGFRGKFIVN